MKYKIYVVSLESATDRRNNIQKQLSKLNIEYEIIDAVNGKTLTEEEISRKCDIETVKKYPNWLTRGAIGCALSHAKVYKKILEDKIDYGIILEDDAQLSEDFEKVVKALFDKNLLNQDTITLLFTQNIRENVVLCSKKDEKKIIYNYTLNYPINKNSLVTAIGYILPNKIANSLDKYIYPIRMASDSWNHFLEDGICKKINCVLPYIVYPYGFDSEIGYSKGGV
ncbi:MAG: glycosyltransferase family 25 protein, partial [Epsilonproteobacteria bacterium]|nr:glycosyltransferase family 25 protein [Campylobacterota bacterium]